MQLNPFVTCCETDLVNLSLVVAVLPSILYGLSRTPLQAAAAFGAIDIAAQLHGSGGACSAEAKWPPESLRDTLSFASL